MVTSAFESLAINLYLAEKYGEELWPASIEDPARSVQWSIWVTAEVERNLLELLNHSVVILQAQRSAEAAAAAKQALAGRSRYSMVPWDTVTICLAIHSRLLA